MQAAGEKKKGGLALSRKWVDGVGVTHWKLCGVFATFSSGRQATRHVARDAIASPGSGLGVVLEFVKN